MDPSLRWGDDKVRSCQPRLVLAGHSREAAERRTDVDSVAKGDEHRIVPGHGPGNVGKPGLIERRGDEMGRARRRLEDDHLPCGLDREDEFAHQPFQPAGAPVAGAELVLACPEEYAFAPEELERWDNVRHVVDPREAVEGAQFVYTDVWVSMGQDEEGEQRRRAFASYQVDESLMAAGADARFLHCLPARRGEEVAAEVIDGPRSAVWKQAENRMHSARGALAWLLS